MYLFNFFKKIHSEKFFFWSSLPSDLKYTIVSFYLLPSPSESMTKKLKTISLVSKEFHEMINNFISQSVIRDCSKFHPLDFKISPLPRDSPLPESLNSTWKNYYLDRESHGDHLNMCLVDEWGKIILRADRILASVDYLLCVYGKRLKIYFDSLDKASLFYDGENPFIALEECTATKDGVVAYEGRERGGARIFFFRRDGKIFNFKTKELPVLEYTGCFIFGGAGERLRFYPWDMIFSEERNFKNKHFKPQSVFHDIMYPYATGCKITLFLTTDFYSCKLVAYDMIENKELWSVRDNKHGKGISLVSITDDLVLWKRRIILDLYSGKIIFRSKRPIAVILKSEKSIGYKLLTRISIIFEV